ncbi:MAG: hypothetical protein QF898_00645 [SAR202 cluster bacterium]|nr:hypothetical protein [SAR202 cluster bacterium]
MLNLKTCPRCKGDMQADRDVYGNFMRCLQCGHYIHLRDEQAIDHEKLLKAVRKAKDAA